MDLAEFQKARRRLWDELVNLRHSWDEYRVLFIASKERVELLNKSARSFFGLSQRLLIRDVILGVSRVTDPPGEGRRTNLTLSLLLKDPRRDDKPAVFHQIEQRLEALRVAAEPIRSHRNKRIGHLDHVVAISDDNLLPKLPRHLIDDVLSEMEAIYNVHNSAMENTTAFFELVPMGGAVQLVKVLEQGWQWWEEEKQRRRERIQHG